MGKALIIGAGGVGRVVAYKCAQNPDVFEEIMIASRTKSKCDQLKKELEGGKAKIHSARVDADSTDDVINLINSFKPDIVINVALPYQDLAIMDACLATKTDYVDTANYEPPEIPKFEYKWQWAYKEKYDYAGDTDRFFSSFTDA
ncbi:MAG: NAD(P)-binding domain-containing protein, partial [Clostridiales bacterium]|nr:NAD(P)-binding domain-containing protein [Clostridiales bacterium]